LLTGQFIIRFSIRLNGYSLFANLDLDSGFVPFLVEKVADDGDGDDQPSDDQDKRISAHWLASRIYNGASVPNWRTAEA
jgi:hypothetical protein